MARALIVGLVLALLTLPGGSPRAAAQADDPNPPAETIKLIFIHHSSGENWLNDENGGLGQALGANNYFVSDTNYGWGPDAIGDRTDIVNWPEWFTGPESGRYLAALFAESGQNAPYTRTLGDPGGENRVILFKSCFPNSMLEGSPNDPPQRGDGLTVGNAKAIYNELLTYFATRPDKLFVAVTAPPVQDSSLAANARAFNTWLMRDWLAGYGGHNVAVFDFYNVLTDKDNHHRFRNGQAEWITDRGGDTSAYASSRDDDHPSRAGNRKAAEEFLPLLNVFVHRWLAAQGEAPAVEQPSQPPAEQATEAPAEQPGEAAGGGEAVAAAAGPMLADMESDEPAWQGYADEQGETTISCGRDSSVASKGSGSLRTDYDVGTGGWASCSLEYGEDQDWRAGTGLALDLHAAQAGQPVIVVAMQSGESWLHFEYRTQTTQAAVDGWQRLEIPWAQLVQAQWEGDGTARLDLSKAIGVSLLFEGPESGHNAGTLWVDEIRLLGAGGAGQIAATQAPAEPPAVQATDALAGQAQESAPAADEAASESKRKGLCPGAGVILVGAVMIAGWRRWKR